MTINQRLTIRVALVMSVIVALTMASTRHQADTGNCGGQSIMLPFTDVMGNVFFCQIAEAYFLALTNGTSATTYGPSGLTPREQVAAFVTRTHDSALRRGSRRAALDQWSTPTSISDSATTTVAQFPGGVRSDGADLWVASGSSVSMVSRVRASDGKLLETWTGATQAALILIARGRVFVTGGTNPNGNLYVIDPRQPAGQVTVLSSSLGANPLGLASDGVFIWTANFGFPAKGFPASVSRVNPDTGAVVSFTTGFTNPIGCIYDGSSIWVTDAGAGKLFRLDTSGAIAQAVNVGLFPLQPIFDGTNIWVPNRDSGTVTVVRASTGTVLANLNGNGLSGPGSAAFDGQRVLITNLSGNSVSLWNASDLTPLGVVSTGAGSNPSGACSDGVNFWIVLQGTDKLARL